MLTKKRDYPNEATRRRSITEREVRDIINAEIRDLSAKRLIYPRHSPSWHQALGAIYHLTELKKDIRAAISRGRKAGAKC